MIKILVSLVIGVAIGLLARQGYDVRSAYSAVTFQWRHVVESDQRRLAAIQALVDYLASRHRADATAITALETSLDDVRHSPNAEIVEQPGSFEGYDRDTERVSADLQTVESSVTNKIGSGTPDFELSPLQSRIEGSGSAAVAARATYNAAALDYESRMTHWLNAALARVMFLPSHLGTFETFGEAGPKNQETILDDDDD